MCVSAVFTHCPKTFFGFLPLIYRLTADSTNQFRGNFTFHKNAISDWGIQGAEKGGGDTRRQTVWGRDWIKTGAGVVKRGGGTGADIEGQGS